MIKMIQVLGTASDSGKSTMAMALCRYFSRKGYSVAPFKAINMSLNSISLADSSEISRAQWLQAIASGSEPSMYMNPFLIKPEGMGKSQIIVQGRPIGSLKVNDYYEYLKSNAESVIKESLRELSSRYDIIIAEGAGSAAEINMEGRDFANIFVSSIYKTPAIVISDIERGGVFASLYGTVKLMKNSELVKYLVINRMRGSTSMLRDGIEKLERLTGKTVIGVIPYSEFTLPGEDSLNYTKSGIYNSRICVIRYPHMENYSDMDPFYLLNIGFTFVDASNIKMLDECDVIILPGSKIVSEDLHYMERSGITEKLKSIYRNKTIIGICGGYQMLGKKIMDKNRVESNETEIKCMGILDVETEYMDKKQTGKVQYVLNSGIFGENSQETGYEIHYGRIIENNEKPFAFVDGMPEGSVHGNIYGTNIHGIFENRYILRRILKADIDDYHGTLEKNIEYTEKVFTNSMDMQKIEKLVL